MRIPFILFGVLIGIQACKKDDKLVPVPPVGNASELITKVTLTFTDPLGVNPTVVATFSDPDGPGGNAPVQFDDITLLAGATYHCAITLFDESKNPIEDITPEVLEEADEHLFCFDVSGANVTITRTDSDGTYEVGLASSWVCGSVSSGSVKVTLKHQTNGSKDGTCTPGETDIEVTFQTVIQ
jgi:hypothetical protein